jgi:hypothetical protein
MTDRGEREYTITDAGPRFTRRAACVRQKLFSSDSLTNPRTTKP